MNERAAARGSQPEIADVNHYDSRVWIRFVDGRTVTLTGEQILDAAARSEEDAHAAAQEELTRAVLREGATLQ